MHSVTLLSALFASGVLATPAHGGHQRFHKRQEVVEVNTATDVVVVATTVTAGDAAAPATPAPVVPVVTESPAAPAWTPHHGWSGFSQPAPSSTFVAPTTSETPVAPTTSAPAAPASTGSSGNQWLDVHNSYRAIHSAVAMTWDDDLAGRAQNMVNGCPSNDVSDHQDPVPGSNWAGGFDSIPDALAGWYNENTDYADVTDNYAANPPSGGPDTGHFSQMVWNASTQLGCGLNQACSGGTQYTCLYLVAGNMVFNGNPEYTENVFAPS